MEYQVEQLGGEPTAATTTTSAFGTPATCSKSSAAAALADVTLNVAAAVTASAAAVGATTITTATTITIATTMTATATTTISTLRLCAIHPTCGYLMNVLSTAYPVAAAYHASGCYGSSTAVCWAH